MKGSDSKTLAILLIFALIWPTARAWMTSSLISSLDTPYKERLLSPARIKWNKQEFIQTVQDIAKRLQKLHVRVSLSRVKRVKPVNMRKELLFLRVM